MASTFERVKLIVVDLLGVEASRITETARFVEDLGADSLNTIELAMGFEEEFNVEIVDADAKKLVTVGDAVAFSDSKLKATT
jgi:acyl carrier protein